MSIERFRGFYTPVCDECEKTIPGGQSYGEAVRSMICAGWEERMRKGVKTHVCTDCLFEQKGYGREGDETCL